jgi:hypothetical protein
LWRGRSAAFTAAQLAAMAAPVVWLSPDEPLVRLAGGTVPEAHPCDAPANGPVVYFQVTRLTLRGQERVSTPVDADHRFFDRVSSFVVRFYFYYREDLGVGRHRHDLEVTEMHLSLDRAGGDDDCDAVRLTRVVGFAHGTDWYSNELRVTADTKLPITILVEEGKHASSPDRNADGLFTPGYDVNRRVHDAWGVRDVMGSGYVFTSSFQSFMQKPRTAPGRVLPPDGGNACAVPPDYRSLPADTTGLPRYTLRPASGLRACPAMEPEGQRLAGMMDDHRFGAAFETDQNGSDFADDLSEPLTGPHGVVPDVALRYDGDLGAAFTMRGLDLTELYVVPRVTWIGDGVSGEALLTRSAAQFMSPYASVGVARARPIQGAAFQTGFVGEVGAKFRVRVTGKRRWLTLGYQFAGARLGVRWSGFDPMRRFRMVVEVGPGVW